MTYTVTQLISGAYYASGIVSREFETVSGTQEADGLNWLNDILGEMVVTPDMIPYEGTTTVTLVVGQEEYSVSDLISADTVTFTYDNVRYPVTETPRDQYFGSGRVNGINSLPFSWHQERELGGVKLYLYFTPDQAYTVTIHGIFRLSSVALGDNLEATLDRFYITYLRYALANRICAEFNEPVPQGVYQTLQNIQAAINKRSRPLDLHIRKQSTLHQFNGINWAAANLFKGYVP